MFRRGSLGVGPTCPGVFQEVREQLKKKSVELDTLFVFRGGLGKARENKLVSESS